VISRQKLVGWILVVVSAAYVIYFIKVRLFTAGLPIDKREWLQFAGMAVCLILGIINVRLAAMREQRRKQSKQESA
jgi:Na+/melibiose symporter-like transporter